MARFTLYGMIAFASGVLIKRASSPADQGTACFNVMAGFDERDSSIDQPVPDYTAEISRV
jgi:hypothetical protein